MVGQGCQGWIDGGHVSSVCCCAFEVGRVHCCLQVLSQVAPVSRLDSNVLGKLFGRVVGQV